MFYSAASYAPPLGTPLADASARARQPVAIGYPPVHTRPAQPTFSRRFAGLLSKIPIGHTLHPHLSSSPA